MQSQNDQYQNDFNLTFRKTRCLGHLEYRNQLYNYLVLNGTPNEIAWIGDIIHNFNKDCFALDPPFCKLYNVMPFCVNTCVAHMYYIMHKQANLT